MDEVIKQDTVIIDCNFLCYRSMLTLMGMSYDNYPTGVIYGFLSQIQSMSGKFYNPRFIFTWDSGKSYRRDVYPEYKKKDKPKDEESENLYRVGKPQFSQLRTSVLPRLGFKNIFIQTGLEADDLIAQIVKDYWKDTYRIVIVSGDNDLCQLLQPGVVIYNPRIKSIYTEEDFIRDKNITPDQWPWVKAVGGCNSDNVKGMKGVAELTAINYLRKEVSIKTREKIDAFDPTFSLSLVKLPHPKTKSVQVVEDECDILEFERFCIDYGFHSFLKKADFSKWKHIMKAGSVFPPQKSPPGDSVNKDTGPVIKGGLGDKKAY